MIADLDGATGSTRTVNVSQISGDLAGDGLTGGSGQPLSVNTDELTLAIIDDQLQVAEGGIETEHIAPDAITDPTIGERTLDDDLVPIGDTGLLGTLLSWLSNRFAAILGGGLGWRDIPPTTLTAVAAHVETVASASLGHVRTGTGSDVAISPTGIISLLTSGASAGTYSLATVTINNKGIVTGISTGTAPVTSVNGLTGAVTLTTLPAATTAGQTAIYNGSAWTAANPVVAGAGITYTPGTRTVAVNNTGGDLNGAHTNALVVGIRGIPLPASPAPTDGQALTYQSSGTQLAWKSFSVIGTGGSASVGTIGIPLTVPFVHATSLAGDLLSITNSNAGGSRALALSCAGTNEALRATATGSGIAGLALNSGTGDALWAQITNASNTKDALHATTNGSGNCMLLDQTGAGASTVAANNLIIGRNAGANVFRVGRAGDVHANGGVVAGGADFAEPFWPDGPLSNYAPGDILAISPNGARMVRKATGAPGEQLAGIYSTSPAVYCRQAFTDQQLAQMIPVAFMGTVPVRVSAAMGAVGPGNRIIMASALGIAAMGVRYTGGLLDTLFPWMVVGTSIGSLSSGTGMVECRINII